MSRTRIKICGVTRVEDAVDAAAAGADAIGLVFHPPASRNISLDTARAILAALPPFVTPVGLFVDAASQHIREVCAALSLRHVQLHGHETPAQVKDLAPLRIIKAVRVSPDTFADELNGWREAIGVHHLSNLTGLVLETSGTKQAGGTGIPNDWTTIQRHLGGNQWRDLPPIIAAGGLTPETVEQVVRMIRPFAVDVSSGVESMPGHKSGEKIEAFIRAVGRADAAGS